MTTTHEGATGNFAYIDNQNLFMATKSSDDPWLIDMRKFRNYLGNAYHIVEAYLFMGAFDRQRAELYKAFQECGYILMFREHGVALKGKKKGNVDVDIVFEMMKDGLASERMERAYLVSGDGDYFRTVRFLIDNDRFGKVLLPSHKNASSLYKQLTNRYYSYLDTSRVRKAIERA